MLVTDDYDRLRHARDLATYAVKKIDETFEDDRDRQWALELAQERLAAIAELLDPAGRPLGSIPLRRWPVRPLHWTL